MWRDAAQSILGNMFNFNALPAKLIGLSIIAAITGFFIFKVYTAGYNSGSAKIQSQWDDARAQIAEKSANEVAKVLKAANQKAAEDRAAFESQNKLAGEQARKAIVEAEAKVADWKKRYQTALQNDASCKKWSEEVIPCPVD